MIGTYRPSLKGLRNCGHRDTDQDKMWLHVEHELGVRTCTSGEIMRHTEHEQGKYMMKL